MKITNVIFFPSVVAKLTDIPSVAISLQNMIFLIFTFKFRINTN